MLYYTSALFFYRFVFVVEGWGGGGCWLVYARVVIRHHPNHPFLVWFLRSFNPSRYRFRAAERTPARNLNFTAVDLTNAPSPARPWTRSQARQFPHVACALSRHFLGPVCQLSGSFFSVAHTFLGSSNTVYELIYVSNRMVTAPKNVASFLLSRF
jgi:hypothetical protein